MFDRVGEIAYKPETGDADTIMIAAIEAGAQDVESSEDGHTITCDFNDIGDVSAALEKELGEAEAVNPTWKPQTTTELDEHKAGTFMKLVDILEDDDDVQNVYSNFEVSDEVLAKLTAE